MTSGRTIAILGAALSAMLVGAAQYYLLDGVTGTLLGALYQDDTKYARDYTDARFRGIKVGMGQAAVSSALGQPLKQVWIYEEDRADRLVVEIDAERLVRKTAGPRASVVKEIRLGISADALISAIGRPSTETWAFSESQHDGSYRIRSIVFRNERVEQIIHEYYWD